MWYFLFISIICWNCSNSVVFLVYFYDMLELFQQCGILCFLLYQYVVIKLRNSIKRIPLHIRINRSNPPHFTACVNPLSRLPTPYVAVFWVFCFVWAFNATAMRWIWDVAFQFPNFRRKDHRTLSQQSWKYSNFSDVATVAE